MVEKPSNWHTYDGRFITGETRTPVMTSERERERGRRRRKSKKLKYHRAAVRAGICRHLTRQQLSAARVAQSGIGRRKGEGRIIFW